MHPDKSAPEKKRQDCMLYVCHCTIAGCRIGTDVHQMTVSAIAKNKIDAAHARWSAAHLFFASASMRSSSNRAISDISCLMVDISFS